MKISEDGNDAKNFNQGNEYYNNNPELESSRNNNFKKSLNESLNKYTVPNKNIPRQAYEVNYYNNYSKTEARNNRNNIADSPNPQMNRNEKYTYTTETAGAARTSQDKFNLLFNEENTPFLESSKHVIKLFSGPVSEKNSVVISEQETFDPRCV